MEKKSYKSWTISDGFWEAVKEEIPERQRLEGKTYKRKPGGGRKPLSKRAANGKQYRKNTEQLAVSINIFRNGQRQDCLKGYGPKVWKNMMNWKGSAGNGKVWMAAW